GAAFTVTTFKAGSTDQKTATFGGAVLSLSGTVRYMDTWTLTLDLHSVPFQVTGDATLVAVAKGLADAAPAGYTAAPIGDRIFLTKDGAAFAASIAADPLAYTGKARATGNVPSAWTQTIKTGSTVEAGDKWTVTIGSQTQTVTVVNATRAALADKIDEAFSS